MSRNVGSFEARPLVRAPAQPITFLSTPLTRLVYNFMHTHTLPTLMTEVQRGVIATFMVKVSPTAHSALHSSLCFACLRF
jgi:hypothetical protein